MSATSILPVRLGAGNEGLTSPNVMLSASRTSYITVSDAITHVLAPNVCVWTITNLYVPGIARKLCSSGGLYTNVTDLDKGMLDDVRLSILKFLSSLSNTRITNGASTWP